MSAWQEQFHQNESALPFDAEAATHLWHVTPGKEPRELSLHSFIAFLTPLTSTQMAEQSRMRGVEFSQEQERSAQELLSHFAESYDALFQGKQPLQSEVAESYHFNGYVLGQVQRILFPEIGQMYGGGTRGEGWTKEELLRVSQKVAALRELIIQAIHQERTRPGTFFENIQAMLKSQGLEGRTQELAEYLQKNPDIFSDPQFAQNELATQRNMAGEFATEAAITWHQTLVPGLSREKAVRGLWQLFQMPEALLESWFHSPGSKLAHQLLQFSARAANVMWAVAKVRQGHSELHEAWERGGDAAVQQLSPKAGRGRFSKEHNQYFDSFDEMFRVQGMSGVHLDFDQIRNGLRLRLQEQKGMV